MWLRISEMLLRSTFNKIASFDEKKKQRLFSLAFGFVVTFIIWITLLSREPGRREIYLIPFYSWFQVIKGNWKWIFDNIGNIVLFVPFGFLLQMLSNKNKMTVLVGLSLSLAIELVQLMSGLGSFEVDDLIHNTTGCLIGAVLLKKLGKYSFSWREVRRECILVLTMNLCFATVISVVFIYQGYQKKIAFASYGDSNEKKNLLILDCKDGIASGTNVNVEYLENGIILISGSSNIESYYGLGRVDLEQGEYIFSGFSGVKDQTIGIYLTYYDDSEGIYKRLTEDIGLVESVCFSLSKDTPIAVGISIHPGCNCDVIAKPVIYKEGD